MGTQATRSSTERRTHVEIRPLREAWAPGHTHNPDSLHSDVAEHTEDSKHPEDVKEMDSTVNTVESKRGCTT